MDLIEVSRALPPALNSRYQQILADMQGAKSRTARELLIECHVGLQICGNHFLAFPNEYKAVNAYIRRLVDSAVNSAQAQVASLEALEELRGKYETVRALLLRASHTGIAASAHQVRLTLLISELFERSAAALLLSLLIAISKPDRTAKEAFIGVLRNGLVDKFLEIIPGLGHCLLVVRAMQAALEARVRRNASADDFLLEGEELRTALLEWAKAMDFYYDGLRSFRGEPSLVPELRA